LIVRPSPAILSPAGAPPVPLGGWNMTWKTPKIVEVSLALEINSYACAEIG
jgi:coenzyme PQQ precursor peptide PqqA